MTHRDKAWSVEPAETLRPYALTGGRTRPSQPMDLSSVVKPGHQTGDLQALAPEKQRIVTLCRDEPLAVVEIAGRLQQPVQVAKILLADLVDTGFLIMAMPTTTERPSIELLERVIVGLRRIA